MRNNMFVNVPSAIISPIIYKAPYIFVEYSHSRIVSLDSIHIQAAKMERNKEHLIFLLCKHPTPMTLQLHPLCLLEIQSNLRS